MDIFWGCKTSTVHEILGFAKEMVRIYKEMVRSVPLPEIRTWPVGGEVETGMAIQMSEKSLENGRNGRKHL